MSDVFPGKLQLWESWAPGVAAGRSAGNRADVPAAPTHADAYAARVFAAEALQSGRAPRDAAEPFSLQWYLEAESVRYGRHGQWLPRLLEFGKHSGEALLGLGDGLGADWVQYARCGAVVTACCPSADALALVRRNFELRGLAGRFLQADPARLPLESTSIDVACVNDLLQTAPDPAALVEEIYRVLKPGGKVLCITPARHDVDYWARWCLPWHAWFRRPAEAPRGHGRRALRRLFGRFVEHRIHKRQLRRSEIPHLFRWLPTPVLARLMGRFMILKAFKPLSAARSLRAAA